MSLPALLRPRLARILLLLVAVLAGSRARAVAAALPELRLDPTSAHHLVVTVPEAGTWEIRTTDVDPFIGTLPWTEIPAAMSVLTFEYTCLGKVDPFEVFVGAPWQESRMQSAGELPYSEGWTTFSINLRPALDRATAPPTRLRLDFGRAPGQVVQIRNLRLRAPDERESNDDARRLARQADELQLDQELRIYLAREFSARISHVSVRRDEIEIAGYVAGPAVGLHLVESPLWQHLTREKSLTRVCPIPPSRPEAETGSFTVVLPRYVSDANGRRDRLFSRWLIVRAGAAADELISAARYADTVAARHALPELRPRSKKGLGGFQVGRAELAGDLDALGIASVTVNLFLARFLRAEPSAKTQAFTFNGRTYHADRPETEKLDRTLLAAAKRDALVLAILLVPKAGAWDTPELGRILQHPDCDPAGNYSMANVTSAEGVAHYAALLDYLAERYSRPGQPFGRIHHWIVHNEVDAGWVWTNCGEKPPVLYVDQYHKSMRLAQLVARQYDPHARAYASLTHFWNWTPNHRFYPARAVLEHLLAFSRVEGDFDWGIAHHPYPESLLEPKTWLDRKVTFAFDTPLITFKNIEVLDAWVKQPAQRYLGRDIRSVHLSEQGPNSRDYSPQALEEQAAAMAYVWKKIRRLDAIQGFQYHNWVDNRREGGLRIGLRRFPDDADDPLGPKPVWHVYRALDTEAEEAACAFALPLIGLPDWHGVPYRTPIGPSP
jgi:hypothetical protein